MGIVNLNKEVFEKVQILSKTYYEDPMGEMHFVEPPKKKGVKPVVLTVGTDLSIQIARKLVQSRKAAAIYAKGKKPKEV